MRSRLIIFISNDGCQQFAEFLCFPFFSTLFIPLLENDPGNCLAAFHLSKYLKDV